MSKLAMLIRLAALGFGALGLAVSLVDPDLAKGRSVEATAAAAVFAIPPPPAGTATLHTQTSLNRR